jgi:hypothetical protein
MKTDPVILRALEARVTTLPGEADVTLPAEVVKTLIADARDAERLDTAITVEGLAAAATRILDEHIGDEEWIGSEAEDPQ